MEKQKIHRQKKIQKMHGQKKIQKMHGQKKIQKIHRQKKIQINEKKTVVASVRTKNPVIFIFKSFSFQI